MTDNADQGGPSALFTDLYELNMLEAYRREGMTGRAVFSLYYRTLPETRNYLVAAGLEDVLAALEGFRFREDEIAWLGETGRYEPAFLDWLATVRFTGDVRAVPEGTPLFPNEPILEVEAPLPEAQIVETLVINRVNVAMLIASKAARIVAAADGRPVYDFGARRAHGIDAGLVSARSAWLAGCAGTSNVLAGRLFDIPLSGTMAHSFVQAAQDELAAFEAFARVFPETVLLVDTYDPLEGVDNVIRLARRLGEGFRVTAIRLDSGDLEALSREARARLDAAGLAHLKILASGGLDEHRLARLVASGAPIDGFGVGTSLATSSDAAEVDVSYKLSAYAGRGRVKLAAGKRHLPGPKQVFRLERDGRYAGDVLARADEALDGHPLLEPVMQGGVRLPAGRRTLCEARAHCATAVARLPESARGLSRVRDYPVRVSEALEAEARTLAARRTR